MLIRESIHLTFFMPHAHDRAGPAVLRAIDAYLDAVGGARTFGLSLDVDGDWQLLDGAEWSRNRAMLSNPKGCHVAMRNADPFDERFAVEYLGWTRTPATPRVPETAVCAVSFWLPTEFLEEHGPHRVHDLACTLARLLPFRSGYGGLAFNCSLDLAGILERVYPLSFRYPGIDILDLENLARHMGNRLRASSWLTFLDSAVTEQLGGLPRLSQQLAVPGMSVQELGEGRVVVSTGAWPEAGDTQQGQSLPAHQALARVLEPHLYQQRVYPNDLFPPEEWRRWERRFLD